MKTNIILTPVRGVTAPHRHAAAFPAPIPVILPADAPRRSEPAVPSNSPMLRDTLSEAERAEEDRQAREREALRRPVGLD